MNECVIECIYVAGEYSKGKASSLKFVGSVHLLKDATTEGKIDLTKNYISFRLKPNFLISNLLTFWVR